MFGLTSLTLTDLDLALVLVALVTNLVYSLHSAHPLPRGDIFFIFVRQVCTISTSIFNRHASKKL